MELILERIAKRKTYTLGCLDHHQVDLFISADVSAKIWQR